MADIAPAISKMNDTEIDTDAAVTEALFTKIAANINALVLSALPVGSLINSLLTESEFQDEVDGTHWVLADGRSVSGSRYESVTGQANIPDLRGLYLRGKNNSRADGKEDPAGELALGAYEADRNKAHNHDFSDPGHQHAPGVNYLAAGAGTGSLTGGATDGAYGIPAATTGIVINSDGGTDGRPRSGIVNIFVRIN